MAGKDLATVLNVFWAADVSERVEREGNYVGGFRRAGLHNFLLTEGIVLAPVTDRCKMCDSFNFTT